MKIDKNKKLFLQDSFHTTLFAEIVFIFTYFFYKKSLKYNKFCG